MGFESGWLARVTLEAREGSQQVVNTLHYDYRGNTLDHDASIGALASRLVTDLLPTYRALFHSGWTIQPLTVVEERDPLNPDDVRYGVTAGTGLAGTRGTVSGDYIPSYSSRVYTLRTGKVGKSFRGRMFISGAMYEADVSYNSWVAAAASNFAYLADAFVAAIPLEPDIVVGPSTDSVNWVVYSPTRRGRSLSDYSNDVVSKTPRAEVHSLRSRALYS